MNMLWYCFNDQGYEKVDQMLLYNLRFALKEDTLNNNNKKSVTTKSRAVSWLHCT